MFHRLRSAIRVRAFAVLLVLHAGAAAQIYGLIGTSGSSLDPERRTWLWVGLAGLYGSFVLGALFIAVPALPWIRRARRVSRWREWLLEELPEILALIPIIIQTLQTLRDAWSGFEQGLDSTPRQPRRTAASATAMAPRRRKPKSKSRAR